MEITPSLKPDLAWFTGIVFLLISAFTYVFIEHSPPNSSHEALFIVNYVLVIIYLLVLWANYQRNGLGHLFLLLNLALISCFALNRTMGVFAPSADWWSVLLVVSCINYGSIFFFTRLPFILQGVISFITGISFVAFFYLAILLFPGYIIGILAAIVIGLSLHVFVPVLFVIYTLVFVTRANGIHRRLKFFFFAGLLFSIGYIAQYAIRWNNIVTRINTSLAASGATGHELPSWVAVAQDCSGTALEETVLKSDLVYGVSDDVLFDLFAWRPSRNFHEKQQHDPLVAIASALGAKTNLDRDDRIAILKALFDARHKAERRLWSDEDLVTTDVSTDVQLWPQLHLSYTEENITVACTHDSSHWPLTQEALYTFHLPEGATVSALSLWIKGKEQKGLLSTRQKADSAYSTIVGHYRRDPSVVHWQEGNTVVVRVYPVTTAESRRFKLGVTAPLELTRGKLAYHSIWFDGPDAAGARSSVRILPMQPLVHPEWPPSFQSDSTGHLRYAPSLLSITAAQQAPVRQTGTYTPNWMLQCEDPGIATTTFRFDGRQYITAAPTHSTEPGGFRQVYLDLNSSWTSGEYESILATFSGFPVYAAPGGSHLIRVTATNKTAVFDAGTARLFSLFPLQSITDYGHSLLITKCNSASPNLSDLNGSDFSRNLQTWLAGGAHLRLYNIGAELSPYLRALRETGVFSYEKGDLATLQNHLLQNEFPTDKLAANEVLIEPGGLLIRRADDPGDTPVASLSSRNTSPATAATSSPHLAGDEPAPDHLLRLFAYRRILQQLKGRLPDAMPGPSADADTAQVQMAQEAGIVSPVSSYIVLESQDDYDKFNIRDDKNGLKNASLQGKGAVPEPGEWAILITVLALFAFIRYRRMRQQSRPI